VGTDPLEKAAQYGRDVLNGKIITGNLVKLAIQRHETDLKQAHHRGLVFCEESAYRVLKTFDYLKHSKGDLAGQVIELEPWQCWIIACVFGWKYQDSERRRYRTVYEEIARKNAKTTKLAGIGLYGLTKDNEGGPEIYAAATKAEQARILFDSAGAMVKQSGALRNRLDDQKHRIINAKNFGKFVPLSADGQTMDGLNPHFALVDELHAHKTSEVWDVLRSALGARSQPLIWAITTAGFNKNGICYEIRDYAIKVLQGIIDDDSFFGIIYTLDDEDLKNEGWKNEENWIKANPNLGISVDIDYLRDQSKQAAVMPTALTNFLTKHLNVWTTGANLWCNVEMWKQCSTFILDKNKDHDFTCWLADAVEIYLGIDLSTVSDIASVGGIAVMADGNWRVFGKHYLPEENVHRNIRKTIVPFTRWAADGWLTLTPGNIIDYEWIKADIVSLKNKFGEKIKEVAFDRWNSSQLVNDLTDLGLIMVGFGQGYVSMNAPMKELERRYLSGQIQHQNDPVLNWTMSNVVAEQDPAGNVKPSKAKSSEKIDPAVAVIMAIGRAMMTEITEQQDPGCEFW